MKYWTWPIWAILVFLVFLTDCSRTAETSRTSPSAASSTVESPIELHFGSSRIDRTAGMGLIEEKLAAEYTRLHPNVHIVFDCADDGVYTRKLQLWKSLDQFPDIFMNWTDAGRFYPLAKEGFLLPLDRQVFQDYGFFDGALDAFTLDGKLWGLTRNTDVWVLMYNRRIFHKFGLAPPASIEDLPVLAKALRAHGIAPIAMNGLEKWNLVNVFGELAIKFAGNQDKLAAAVAGSTRFADEPALRQAANYLKILADSGVFQDDYLSSDYNAAKTAFIEGRTAMYYMGTFEMSILSDLRYSAAEKKEIGAMLFPGTRASPSGAGDVMGRFGGGYCIWARTKYPEEAKDFLTFFFKPENWAKLAWQLGVATPAQDWSRFSQSDEPTLLRDITGIMGKIRSRSGMFFNERINSTFAEYVLDITVRLVAGKLTPAQFLAEIDRSAAENRGKP